ncbi:MAG: hypothetical protein KDD20_12650 [Mangrovimonas sp.]|nr:hypothetical protein [Mangrovimonas sp.]
MKYIATLLFVAIGSLNGFSIKATTTKHLLQNASVNCTEDGCEGRYEGPEFVNNSDVAHQLSNKVSRAVGDELKNLYKAGNYRKVDFSNIEMSTMGMGTGQVVYSVWIPFVQVNEKCEAYTSFDHSGGWNHAPALERRKKELAYAIMPGHDLDISDLKVTPEGLQEYWIQWKNKDVQRECQ